MLHRIRNTWLAGGGALLLVLSMSGLAGAANLVTDTTTGTPLAFVDVNGNGIADTCETGVVAPVAGAPEAALAAADLNGDGTISVTEAAQSGWVGGVNCNHGGYVSSVAQTSTDTCDQATGDSQDATDTTENANEDSTDSSGEDAADQTADASATTVSTVTTTTATTASTCSQTSTDTTVPTTAVCPVVAPVAPVGGTAPVVDTSPNAHGLAVSTVAQSAAVGGKNCNHGGAVSEAAHAAHGLTADKAAKAAARLAKHQGKGHKH
jgi:hypothetical protein